MSELQGLGVIAPVESQGDMLVASDTGKTGGPSASISVS